MVNIFADTIYQETASITVTENQDLVDFPDMNFSPVSVDTELGGFTYAETLLLTFSFQPSFLMDSIHSTNTEMDVRMSPTFEFNGAIDLFVNIGQLDNFQIFEITIPQGATNFTVSGSPTEVFTLDLYLDTPATLEANVDFREKFNGNDRLVSSTDQTITAELKAEVIGRQP